MKINVFFQCFIFGILLSSCYNRSSLDDFEIQDDFNMELFASEPWIVDPVDLEFNELGDPLVLEMPGYPFEDTKSRLKVLLDNNKDGIIDSCKIIFDDLGLASSFLPINNGILVASPPYLLFLQDIDLDYQIEKIDTLMGGFVLENLQHNYNGLSFGLDGWIYAANGGNDGKPYWWREPETEIDLRGQDFRFHIKKHVLEKLGESSGGFGMAMDEYGRIFETHNLNHISHLVFPDRYLKNYRLTNNQTLSNISNHEENGLARIYPIGEQEERVNHSEQSGYFSGSCGITYYGGGSFGEKYQNTVWVADVVLNLIHIDKIKPHGSSLEATRLFENKDFLASSDRSFRPVNMTVGPDGSVFILDMHRKVIEHPEWIPDEIENNLDIESGKDQGRIYIISKNNRKITDLDFKNIDFCLQSISNSNQWIRNIAHRKLLDFKLEESHFQVLQHLVNNGNDFAQLHSSWILAEKNQFERISFEKILSHKNSAIRENALKIIELKIQDPYYASQIFELMDDSSSRVRMQAALSLSQLPKEIKLNLINEYISSLLKYSHFVTDLWQNSAFSLAAADFSDQLFTKLLNSNSSNLEAIIALTANLTDFNLALNEIQKANISNKSKSILLEKIANYIPRQNVQSSEAILKKFESTGNVALIVQSAAIRQKFGLPISNEFFLLSNRAKEFILDDKTSEEEKLEYMHILEFIPYQKKASTLFACLNNQQPLKLQEAALKQLSKLKEKEIGWEIVKIWRELSPITRTKASDLLLYVDSNHDALLSALENGEINIGEMNFDLERRRTLLWWTDNKKTQERAAKLFSDAGVVNRSEVIKKMKPALDLVGNSKKGKEVFINICSSCHQYKNTGVLVGPVLTEISRKAKSSIMSEILDPNANVDTKYINHIIETKDGGVYSGIIQNETNSELSLIQIGGEKIIFSKRKIKNLRSTGKSLMMEGLESSLSHQEMADLLAYLRS